MGLPATEEPTCHICLGSRGGLLQWMENSEILGQALGKGAGGYKAISEIQVDRERDVKREHQQSSMGVAKKCHRMIDNASSHFSGN